MEREQNWEFSNAGPEPEPGTHLSRRIYVGAPTETVWEWLVDPDRVYEYHLLSMQSRPMAVGDPLEYASKLAGHVVVHGEVREWMEARRLVHTFQFESDFPEEPSQVTWELLRYGDAMCLLTLTHERLTRGGETYASVQNSWDVILSSLKTVVETGRPLPWPSRHR